MAKRITYAALAILLLALTLATPIVIAISLPPQYSDTFVGELNEKYDRLNSDLGEKIVVIGGSSVAFGLDSEALERYTGMPVVNFGLYAALGTRMMLDLSLSGIGEGDVVIISPELDPQTLSMYFNNKTALKALDDDYSMLKYLSAENYPGLVAASWSHAQDKMAVQASGGGEDGGIYLSRYFDAWGDFDYPRVSNIMPLYYDPSTPVCLEPEALGADFSEFADYLDRYIKRVRSVGATVYFALPPVNELALTAASRDPSVSGEYLRLLSEAIDCEIINGLEDAVMPAGYFFDTNYHLNEAGRTVHTARLATAIRIYEGITEGIVDNNLPEPPSLPGMDAELDVYDSNDRYFTYLRDERFGYYVITGLTEEGRQMTELTIPVAYNGIRVLSVDRGAFAGGRLRRLNVTADTSLASFGNGAFEGATSLSELWLYISSGDSLTPPADFAGVAKGFTVHVPRGSDFKNHYYWSERGLTFEEFD